MSDFAQAPLTLALLINSENGLQFNVVRPLKEDLTGMFVGMADSGENNELDAEEVEASVYVLPEMFSKPAFNPDFIYESLIDEGLDYDQIEGILLSLPKDFFVVFSQIIDKMFKLAEDGNLDESFYEEVYATLAANTNSKLPNR